MPDSVLYKLTQDVDGYAVARRDNRSGQADGYMVAAERGEGSSGEVFYTVTHKAEENVDWEYRRIDPGDGGEEWYFSRTTM